MVPVITDTASLEVFCTSLVRETFITVDTEFIREKTYYPQLCLIQVAGETQAAVIDPLAKGIDLQSLHNLLINSHVLKVFHACRQDMEIFYHAMKTLPTPVFDTQIAAMVCGFGESVSYETLVNKITGASIDKSSRFTDWSRRPLTDKQLTYALDDVLHLRTIYSALIKQLLENDRMEWIKDEMQPMLDPKTYESDPPDAWQRLRLRSTSPRYLAVLQAAAHWREVTARERNVPRGRVMKDDTLVEVANMKPDNYAALQEIRGFHPTMQAAYYTSLFTMLKEVDSMPASSYPRLPGKPQYSTESETLVDMLRILLKHCAGKNHIVPRILADKDELEALANGKRDNLRVLQGWRYDIFGKDALRLLEGKIAFKADQKSGIAFIAAE